MSDTAANLFDACDMQFVYQGVIPNSTGGEYNLIPYRLGLLTLTR